MVEVDYVPNMDHSSSCFPVSILSIQSILFVLHGADITGPKTFFQNGMRKRQRSLWMILELN